MPFAPRRRRGFPGSKLYATLRLHVPVVTLNLMLINVAVFLLMILIPPLGRWILATGEAWPAAVLHGQVWRLFTYMFLHSGGAHLLCNMFTLFMFGSILENHVGARQYLTFYVVCGLGAAIVHLVSCVIGGAPNQLMIGASGALYGVLFATAFHFPDITVFMQFIYPIKLRHMVWIFGVASFLGSVGSSGSEISHITHLGGLLTALIWIFGGRWWNRFRGPRGPRGNRRNNRRRGLGGHVEELYDDPHWKLDQ